MGATKILEHKTLDPLMDLLKASTTSTLSGIKVDQDPQSPPQHQSWQRIDSTTHSARTL